MEEETKTLEIVKARSDKREYRRIILKNSLTVLLISDPETDKCAASMDVGVGNYSDPEGLEGLAHFLEHMLFYASEKYPEEDSYSKFITEHGGITNAFTSSEHTNYYFDVNPDSFEEALDRFAQFFIKPLMSPDATTREIKAVDSEYQKNLLSDGWRMSQLEKHLSSKDHPYHKFSTGNWNTLELRPKEKGLDTRQELLKFYKEYYSANIMHLVLYGKDSLDISQKLVENKFQEILNINRSHVRFIGQPCSPEYLQIFVKAVPITEGHKLRVTWPITPGTLHYKMAPSGYLSHLIGHEGEGSIFYILKKLGWASSLWAGGSDCAHEFAFFQVDIELTDAGHEHYQEIVGLVFKYIDLLQQSGAQKWIFDELSCMGETHFHYQDKIPPIDSILGVSSNMRLYPPEDWLVGALPKKFNSDIIQVLLDELNSNNVRIFWASKKFEGNTDMSEPWYGTSFSVEKITSSQIQQWKESVCEKQLQLPAPNMFIPSDLSLKNILDKAGVPLLLRKSRYSRLWYKPDTAFCFPKAYIKIDFNCPHSRVSPESVVLTCLFSRLVMDYLNEYAYYADVAGLYYGVSNYYEGFQVTLVGYNHKMRILLETIIEGIAKFEVKPDRFSVMKELLIKDYQNLKFQQPYQLAKYYCSLALQYPTFPWKDELEVLHHLEADDLVQFYPLMLSRVFLECFIAGNLEPTEAEKMVQYTEDIFFSGTRPISDALFTSQHLTHRVVKLKKGINYCYATEGLNPSDENSALVHYIQVHQDDSVMNIMLQLFALIAKQPAFHQLRTVEQLGYITSLALRNFSGVYGVQFIVQSTIKGPRHLDSRTKAFLKMFENKLYEMSSHEFKSNVNALTEMKLEKFKNLHEESAFYWCEIASGTLKFDRIEHEVAALKQLTQEQFIDFFNERIKVGAPRKKAVSVFVYGNSHLSEYEADKSELVAPEFLQIEDICSFRRSRPLYGSFKGGLGHMKA
nr:insulin-degrading enzyme-like 1, peroxisomal isoform X1 [Coffea arabica]